MDIRGGLDPIDVKDYSPAYKLLQHVWNHEGETSGASHSWRRLNAAMQSALRLAIVSGMIFHEDDFAHIRRAFSSTYWIDHEHAYSLACDGPHGKNPSAIKAIEKVLGRKPFIVTNASDMKSKIRLHVGSRFYWHQNMKRRVFVEVTSFTTTGDGKTPAVVACTPKPSRNERPNPNPAQKRLIIRNKPLLESPPMKGRRIFRITHEDIRAFNKAIREHVKEAATK